MIAAGCPLGQAGEPLQVFSPFAEIFGADIQPEAKQELDCSIVAPITGGFVHSVGSVKILVSGGCADILSRFR